MFGVCIVEYFDVKITQLELDMHLFCELLVYFMGYIG